MVALVDFAKQFRHCLLGRSFVVITDHWSLQPLRNFKDLGGKVARGQKCLQEYNFGCLHRAGTLMLTHYEGDLSAIMGIVLVV